MLTSNDLIQEIQKHGASSYPSEACGVVVKRGKKSVVVPCKNVSETPRTHFVMDLNDYSAAADTGEIIGIWHTHVDLPSRPSDADRAGCENSELPWFIIGVRKGKDDFVFEDMQTIEPNGFEMPYLERPYAFGVFDCWSLARDFYRREYGIKLGDYPRIERFWAKGNNFFGDPINWEREGMVRLIDQNPKEGDLFLIQSDSTGNPNHIVIYIGNDMILHHCVGRLSTRDIYGGYWQKHTVTHLRHRTKL